MFRRDQITHEAVVERLPGGDLTIAKDAHGQKAWGVYAKQGLVRYFPTRGAAKKALKLQGEGP